MHLFSFNKNDNLLEKATFNRWIVACNNLIIEISPNAFVKYTTFLPFNFLNIIDYLTSPFTIFIICLSERQVFWKNLNWKYCVNCSSTVHFLFRKQFIIIAIQTHMHCMMQIFTKLKMFVPTLQHVISLERIHTHFSASAQISEAKPITHFYACPLAFIHWMQWSYFWIRVYYIESI